MCNLKKNYEETFFFNILKRGKKRKLIEKIEKNYKWLQISFM